MAVRPAGQSDEATAERALAEAVESGQSVVLVATRADQSVAGFCSAYLDLRSVRYGLRCWVEDLAVDPRERSRGVGELLLTRAFEWAGEQGATHLELDTGTARVDARRFYERLKPDAETRAYGWRL